MPSSVSSFVGIRAESCTNAVANALFNRPWEEERVTAAQPIRIVDMLHVAWFRRVAGKYFCEILRIPIDQVTPPRKVFRTPVAYIAILPYDLSKSTYHHFKMDLTP